MAKHECLPFIKATIGQVSIPTITPQRLKIARCLSCTKQSFYTLRIQAMDREFSGVQNPNVNMLYQRCKLQLTPMIFQAQSWALGIGMRRQEPFSEEVLNLKEIGSILPSRQLKRHFTFIWVQAKRHLEKYYECLM